MLREQRHPAECLAAPVAGVLLHVAVSLQVGPQVAPVGERAVAMLTTERLLAGVRPDVTLEQPRPGERLAACRALAGQRVRPDVHLQRAQADVHLLAELARERLPRLALGGRAMELLVLRQPGVSRVRFVAIRAQVLGRRRARRGRAGGRVRALLHLDDCGSGGGAARGRSAALAARRGQIFRGHGGWRAQRAGTHGARGRQAAVIRTGPVRVAPGDRSLNRRAGERAVGRRRDRRVMLRGGVRIHRHRIRRVQFRSGIAMMIGGRWIRQIMRRVERGRASPRRSGVVSQRLHRGVEIQRLQGRLARHKVQRR